ncbi:MAG: hypothetical protein NT018_09415, partial [Armatimonadetes bacterium]|nr:hypothetical protein [Armatimonadota bacterium]
MSEEPPKRHGERPQDVASEILHEVGDELAAVVSVPGEITYRTLNNFFEFLGDSAILIAQTKRFNFKGAINIRDTISQMAIRAVYSH